MQQQSIYAINENENERATKVKWELEMGDNAHVNRTTTDGLKAFSIVVVPGILAPERNLVYNLCFVPEFCKFAFQ